MSGTGGFGPNLFQYFWILAATIASAAVGVFVAYAATQRLLSRDGQPQLPAGPQAEQGVLGRLEAAIRRFESPVSSATFLRWLTKGKVGPLLACTGPERLWREFESDTWVNAVGGPEHVIERGLCRQSCRLGPYSTPPKLKKKLPRHSYSEHTRLLVRPDQGPATDALLRYWSMTEIVVAIDVRHRDRFLEGGEYALVCPQSIGDSYDSVRVLIKEQWPAKAPVPANMTYLTCGFAVQPEMNRFARFCTTPGVCRCFEDKGRGTRPPGRVRYVQGSMPPDVFAQLDPLPPYLPGVAPQGLLDKLVTWFLDR